MSAGGKKRGKYENIFKRTGKASRRAAQRLARMGACARVEALRMLASDADLMNLVFDQAVMAGVVEYDPAACAWVGRDVARARERFTRLRVGL